VKRVGDAVADGGSGSGAQAVCCITTRIWQMEV
jgi:hypothetical protein